MRIGFIGAGKVGCSLGKYLKENGYTVSGYLSRNYENSKFASEFTESVCFGDLYSLAEKSDIIFITVRDGEILGVWKELSLMNIKGKIICHCSGALSCDIFTDAINKGVFVCSAHPILAVSDKYNGYKNFAKAFFTLEGDSYARGEIKKILESMGNKVKIINSEKKALYHISCVFQSNLINALIYSGICFLKEFGFNEEEAYFAVKPLVMGNIKSVFEKGVINALTGPVERNDTDTVIKHMGVLKDMDKAAYKILSNKLSDIASLKNPDISYDELKKVLEVL